MKYFFIYLCAVLLLSPFIDSEDSVVIYEFEIHVVLKHSTSTGNKKYVDKITTPRKPINRTTSLTSLDVYFRPTVVLDAPIYIHFNAYKKFATQYKPLMVNGKWELCELLKLKTHPLYKFFWNKTNQTDSNLLDICPLKGHRFMRPYYTSYNHFPPLIPTGMWRTDIKFTKEFDGIEEEIFMFRDYYEITPKGIIEF